MFFLLNQQLLSVYWTIVSVDVLMIKVSVNYTKTKSWRTDEA